MMSLKLFLLPVLFVLASLTVSAQTDVFGNRIPTRKTTVKPIPAHYNQTDAEGLKQGPWEKRYTDGSPLYKATFKNNKPVGKYTRYYPNGKKSLEIIYDENGEYGDARLFDQDGKLNSSGRYRGKQKIETWTYYGEKEIILATEEFVDGRPHGQYKVFYPGGAVAEIIHWRNGKKDGEWLKFFEDGAPLLKARYQADQLQGKYLYYYKNGQLEIDANYIDNKEDGNWTFYLADGKVNYVLKYNKGTLLNPEVLEERRAKEEAEFQKQKDKLKDPEKMQNNPEMYMR
ncbi:MULTISPECIES: toxin-antitoxin system YwqK family antitoxin [unclassified Carboxylicivirga]|uniref:toxin-antitoxin system YwqK family antitoxin n=1 Tax=Carboxylicivirga TaxID=1628153 RepID=UPI003D32F55A